jgi:hypothetical protein
VNAHFRWQRAVVAITGLVATVVVLGVGGAALLGADAPAQSPNLAVRTAGIPDNVQTFLTENCTDCHNATDKVGRLDLTSLAYEPADGANFALWTRIHDRVKAGEMPPPDMPRPAAAASAAFVKSLAGTLVASELDLMGGEGRAVQRRMNRYEYEDALRDLLGLPMAQIKDKLPQDGEAYRFNKSAEALDISYVQMQRFMTAADYALRLAISEHMNHPAGTKRKSYARDVMGNYQPRENGTLPDRLSFPVLDAHAQPEVRMGRAPVSTPETREREAVGKVSSIFSDAGGYSWGQLRAPATGRYHLRIAGYTVWVSGGGIARWFYEGQGNEKAPVYYLPLWHRPNLDEVWRGRNDEPMAVFASSSGQVRQVGVFDFKPQPTVSDVDVMLTAGEVIQTDATRFFRTRVNGTDEQYVNPLAQRDGMPGYAMQWVEMEGPFYDDTAGSGYTLLFGDLPLRRLDNPGKMGVTLEAAASGAAGGGGRGGARGGRGGGGGAASRGVVVEVDAADPAQDAQRLIRNFLAKAYRHPATGADAQRFSELFQEQYAIGVGFAKAMVSTYTAILASPGYVFLEEKPGRLDDYSLATRLSLFLWNSTPDEQLESLAAKGELHKPEVLRQQTERLLNDPKSRRFVDAFTDYWLDLRKIDDTSPSSTLYNDYDMDDALKLSAVEETQQFFAELVQANLPVRNVVDSDFAFLNERLSRHYGIPGVTGAAMRKVSLPADSLRGGLMTQASILKVTANGTTTSPVLRGHWIVERILGMEIQPPPPSVKAVEPDIRGAVTIRQQLDKHRADPTCASCHSIMDPSGFALESFDIMGGYRTRYRAASEDVKPVFGFGVNGQAYAFHYGLPVDSAGQLPDGRPFKDVRELKALLVKDDQGVARNLVKELTIFATGAPVRFSDRDQVEQIVQHLAPGRYGVRDMIHEIVQSALFQSK